MDELLRLGEAVVTHAALVTAEVLIAVLIAAPFLIASERRSYRSKPARLPKQARRLRKASVW